MNIKELKAVFFDYGHWYNWDQWAVANWTTERKEVLELASDIHKIYLQINEFKNIPVYHMWTADNPESLRERCSKINRICRENWYNRSNSILISCHLNAWGGRWVEAWYETGKLDSHDLWNDISEAVSNCVNIPMRITKPDSTNNHRRLWILRDTIPTATLIELCFLDNKYEADIIKNPVRDDLFARWILRWIKKHLGIVLEKM